MVIIIDCLLFNSSRFLLNISCTFQIYASCQFIHAFIFKILDNLYFHYSEFFFSGTCLFPFFMFGPVGFYHVPSSAACFSIFSFCLICCVCGIFSVGWKDIVLYYGICPSWVGLDQCLVKVSCFGNLWLCSGGWSWISSL